MSLQIMKSWSALIVKRRKTMIQLFRTIACLILIGLGGAVTVVLENAILGIIISSGGVMALALPLIIETDEYIEKRNREERLRQAWERNK